MCRVVMETKPLFCWGIHPIYMGDPRTAAVAGPIFPEEFRYAVDARDRAYLPILNSCDVSILMTGAFTGRLKELAVQISRTILAARITPVKVNP